MPNRPVTLPGEPRFRRRVETHHVEISARRALRALRRMYPVPDRRMRLLHWRNLHRHIAEGKSLAGKIQDLAGEALEHQLDGLGIDFLRVRGIGTVVFRLDRNGAAAEADLESAAAQLIEHA